MPAHDVLIIGAGLAGQRAALAAAQAGASVAIMSKVHPVRSHSVAAAGGINAAIAIDDDWTEHAYDTVKGSDFLGDQDAIEIMCSEAPGEAMHLEHIGVTFHRNEKGELDLRAFGGASKKRTAYVADITGQAILHVLYEQLMRFHESVDRYEEWFATSLILDDDGHCAGAVARDIRTRRDGDLRREVRDPRLRRQRPVLQADDERAHLHGRRDRAGLPGRRADHGHGDGPVPPDDARRERLSHHRGRPRRGRAPAELRGPALHGGLRAQQDGARLARRRLARRADGDQRGPRRRPRRPGHLPRHHRRAEEARPRGAARDREHRARLRRHGHHARADHDPPRPALHHGRREDRRPTARRRSPASTPPARSPASRSTAATASGPTRCWTRSSSAAAPASTPPPAARTWRCRTRPRRGSARTPR